MPADAIRIRMGWIDYSKAFREPDWAAKIDDGRYVLYHLDDTEVGRELYRVYEFRNTRAERLAAQLALRAYGEKLRLSRETSETPDFPGD